MNGPARYAVRQAASRLSLKIGEHPDDFETFPESLAPSGLMPTVDRMGRRAHVTAVRLTEGEWRACVNVPLTREGTELGWGLLDVPAAVDYIAARAAVLSGLTVAEVTTSRQERTEHSFTAWVFTPGADIVTVTRAANGLCELINEAVEADQTHAREQRQQRQRQWRSEAVFDSFGDHGLFD